MVPVTLEAIPYELHRGHLCLGDGDTRGGSVHGRASRGSADHCGSGPSRSSSRWWRGPRAASRASSSRCARSAATSAESTAPRTWRCRARCRRSPAFIATEIVDAVGNRFAASRARNHEVVDTDGFRRFAGRHARPTLLKGPTSSFFLVSSEMTGWPLRRLHLPRDVAKLRVRSG